MNNSVPEVQGTKDIESDIWTIVGGDFNPDSLGQKRYESILSRAVARASEYISVFDSLFLGSNFDAMLQSNLYLPSFLEIVAESELDRTLLTAERLLKQYDAVLIAYDNTTDKTTLFTLVPDEIVSMYQRLDARRRELRRLIST